MSLGKGESLLYVEGEELLSVGSYLLALGAFIAAVGEMGASPEGDTNKRLIRDGNAVQAVANALQGVGRLKLIDEPEEDMNVLGMIGTFVQASGNAINSFATNEERENPSLDVTRLNTLGSVIQSMGAGLETAGVVHEEESTTPNLEIVGNSLITLGATLDAIGILTPDEKKNLKRILLATGGWVEFAGAIIVAYAINK
jgi:hypothetical protein